MRSSLTGSDGRSDDDGGFALTSDLSFENLDYHRHGRHKYRRHTVIIATTTTIIIVIIIIIDRMTSYLGSENGKNEGEEETVDVLILCMVGFMNLVNRSTMSSVELHRHPQKCKLNSLSRHSGQAIIVTSTRKIS